MKIPSRGCAFKDCARILSVFLIFWMITACKSEQNKYVEPPPPKVTVAHPLQQEVIDYLEFTGTTRAYEDVEVRARVAGFLQSMHFSPGTRVEKGALLFEIDPKEYLAELHAAQAELSSANARLKRAQTELERSELLFKQKAGAEKDVVKWRGDRDIARASVLRAKAQVEKAQLNLGYTKVTAPITGRVSRNYVDVGNLVGEGEPTLLTKVTLNDPMYVYFNLSELDLLRVSTMYRKRVEEKGLNPDEDPDSRAEINLWLGLANEEGFPHEGVADFAESSVDPGTGTLQLRGVFPNPGPAPKLFPGLFARLRMPIDKRSNALLVTERAIGADQSGNYLLAVNSDNEVEKRTIRMGRLVDGLRVIEEGIQPGERIIVKGVQRARPGAKVDPDQIDMKTLTASAIKAAAEANMKKTKKPDSEKANAQVTESAP